jgi:hypothetical protein
VKDATNRTKTNLKFDLGSGLVSASDLGESSFVDEDSCLSKDVE